MIVTLILSSCYEQANMFDSYVEDEKVGTVSRTFFNETDEEITLTYQKKSAESIINEKVVLLPHTSRTVNLAFYPSIFSQRITLETSDAHATPLDLMTHEAYQSSSSDVKNAYIIVNTLDDNQSTDVYFLKFEDLSDDFSITSETVEETPNLSVFNESQYPITFDYPVKVDTHHIAQKSITLQPNTSQSLSFAYTKSLNIEMNVKSSDENEILAETSSSFKDSNIFNDYSSITTFQEGVLTLDFVSHKSTLGDI